MVDDEVLYSFRVNKHNSLCITKWEGMRRYPAETYIITDRGKGRCDCIGSMRTPYCKHRKMVDEVLPKFKDVIFMGSFLDLQLELLYLPEDGEGLPLKGAVDILEEARQQGKAY